MACIGHRSYLTQVHRCEHTVVVGVEEVEDLFVHFDIAFGALRNDELFWIEVLVAGGCMERQWGAAPTIPLWC